MSQFHLIKEIKNKCKDTRGISILFAMLFFVVASMVSITIVSAALSSVKSIHEIKNNESNSLALESGVNLVKEELTSKPYVNYTSQTKAGQTDPTVTTDSVGSDFDDVLVTLVENIHKSDDTESFTITSPSTDGTQVINVSATLYGEQGDDSDYDSYELIFKFSTDSSDMYLIYKGSLDEYTTEYGEGTERVTENVQSYNWSNPTVSGYKG